MTLAQKRKARLGFTLIELLVVVTIIAILMGLTAAAVFKVFGPADDLTVRNDITQLSSNIAGFKHKMDVDYLPSRFVLRERGPWNVTNPLERDSHDFLRNMFSGIDLSANTLHDWNGDGVDGGNTPITLEGDQCLVFFLGGIPQRDPSSGLFGTTGFHASNRTPTRAGGDRRGPFFTFPSKRLAVRSGTQGNFPSFIDPYETQPFAYFSNYGIRNRYNKYGSSDCAGLGVAPYQQNAANFQSPAGFQIICAGKDKTFGPGGLPAAATAATADDMANFQDTALGQ
jgi:prepilin-type N-terminal cleavage/methylation domain-containing protein